MEQKDILKYLAYAAAAYIVWVYVLEPLVNGEGEAAGTPAPAGKTPEQIAAEAAAASAKTKAEADAAAERIKAAEAERLRNEAAAKTVAANDASTLAANLVKLAGKQGADGQLNVDGWNYYLRQLNPNAVVSDLAEVGIQRVMPLFVNQYLQHRMMAGLMPAAAPYYSGVAGIVGIPSRMLN